MLKTYINTGRGFPTLEWTLKKLENIQKTFTDNGYEVEYHGKDSKYTDEHKVIVRISEDIKLEYTVIGNSDYWSIFQDLCDYTRTESGKRLEVV